MSNERTDVYYGTENVLNAGLQFFTNSKEKIDTYMNYTRPQLAITIESIRNAFVDAKKRFKAMNATLRLYIYTYHYWHNKHHRHNLL